MKSLFLILTLLFAPLVMADDVNKIAASCKAQWSGKKGMQSYCIKNQRNYKEWLTYIRKRVYASDASRVKMDTCTRKYRPNYQKAYECYFD